jgi:steroid delta-isomerase-like uncharacterized protein
MRSTSETTSGAFALMEHWDMPPGFATPYHTHHREDEAFYVLEGEVAFVCDGKWLKTGAGAYVYGPREIPHGFKVIGTGPAQMLILCAPGSGFERFVLEQATPIGEPPSPPDMAKLLSLAATYRIDIHGPLPEEPAGFGSAAADPESLNQRWIQAFNDRDWETERALRSSNFQAYLSGSEKPLDNSAWSGFMIQFTTAFPDSRISIDSSIAAGDSVSTRWTLTGTHNGVFQGIPPTGRPVKFTGIEFNRVVNGKIADHWSQFDLVSLMQQIGPA